MRTIRIIFLLIVASTAAVSAVAEATGLKSYVEELIQEGHNIFHDKSLSESERKKKTNDIIRSHLYLEWMAKYSLGRFRREIPKAKIDEFTKVYSDFVVKAYSDLATNYNGEKAILTNIKQLDDDLFIVNTEILKPGNQSPIKVDYLVHKVEGKVKDPYLVGDIITEGISLLNSQQGEFNSVLSTRGIDSLISDLKKRINNQTASNITKPN
ncbi:MAG: phospholipid-binding protein MlaC [Rickettsiaceae bacterium]